MLNVRRRSWAVRLAVLLAMAITGVALAIPLDPSGDPDTTFSGDGKNSANFAQVAQFAEARGVAMQSGGRMVLGGSTTEGGTNTGFALIRLDANGLQDMSFGDGGRTKVPVGNNGLINDVAVHPADSNPATTLDDRIVAVGFANAANNDFAVARLMPDGALDTQLRHRWLPLDRLRRRQLQPRPRQRGGDPGRRQDRDRGLPARQRGRRARRRMSRWCG